MERHAQYINRGELAGRGGSLLWHQSAGGERLHFASLFVFFSFPPLLFFVIFLFITIIIIISLLLLLVLYFTVVIKPFLSQPTSFTFFPFLLLTPLGGGRGKRLRGAELLTGVKPRQLQKQYYLSLFDVYFTELIVVLVHCNCNPCSPIIGERY